METLYIYIYKQVVKPEEEEDDDDLGSLPFK
jgi:hypothetical protein